MVENEKVIKSVFRRTELDKEGLEDMIEFFAKEINKYNLMTLTHQQKGFVDKMLQAHSRYQTEYVARYGHEHQIKRKA
jgi:hypothetical protein